MNDEMPEAPGPLFDEADGHEYVDEYTLNDIGLALRLQTLAD